MSRTERDTEAAEARTVWSVGHGARSIEGFLAILRDDGIETLVDVRTAPGSRKHPHFGRDRLEAALEREGIAYAWRKDLGGWRTADRASPHVALRSPSFRGYADYMGSPAFGDALAWLEATAAAGRTAFMCAESLWWRCHRRLISDALTARGWRVLHLGARAGAEPHALHPAARVQGGRLVYDVPGPEQQALPRLETPQEPRR